MSSAQDREVFMTGLPIKAAAVVHGVVVTCPIKTFQLSDDRWLVGKTQLGKH